MFASEALAGRRRGWVVEGMIERKEQVGMMYRWWRRRGSAVGGKLWSVSILLRHAGVGVRDSPSREALRGGTLAEPRRSTPQMIRGGGSGISWV